MEEKLGWKIRIDHGAFGCTYHIISSSIEKSIEHAVRIADKDCSGKITRDDIRSVERLGEVYVE